MKRVNNGKKAGIKHFAAFLPVVVVFVLSSFLLIRNEILNLSTERITLISDNYSAEISSWTTEVLRELGIFKDVADDAETLDEQTLRIISASYGSHDAYPYGIYWGDEYGNYFDSSDWVPDGDYVPSERDWYIEGLTHSEFAFGEPYLDEMTGDTCVSVTVRMDKGGVESVMSADVYLDYAARLTAKAVETDIEKAFFATSGNKMIIACDDSDEVGKILDSDGSKLYRRIAALIDTGFTGQKQISTDGGWYVNLNRIDNTDWFFVTCTSRFKVVQKMLLAEVIMLAVCAVICTALILMTFRASREMSETYQRAKTDPLTKLYNRDGFRALTLLSLESVPNQGVMMIFDMDNFKLVNDRLGHPEGDEVLKMFADLLNSYFNRGGDINARIGGDEFTVFAGRPLNLDETTVMLGKFIEKFHAAFDEKYRDEKLSVSIGAAFVSDGGDYAELYHRADTALYRAKQNGKDGFFIARGYKPVDNADDEEEDEENAEGKE